MQFAVNYAPDRVLLIDEPPTHCVVVTDPPKRCFVVHDHRPAAMERSKSCTGGRVDVSRHGYCGAERGDGERTGIQDDATPPPPGVTPLKRTLDRLNEDKCKLIERRRVLENMMELRLEMADQVDLLQHSKCDSARNPCRKHSKSAISRLRELRREHLSRKRAQIERWEREHDEAAADPTTCSSPQLMEVHALSEELLHRLRYQLHACMVTDFRIGRLLEIKRDRCRQPVQHQQRHRDDDEQEKMVRRNREDHRRPSEARTTQSEKPNASGNVGAEASSDRCCDERRTPATIRIWVKGPLRHRDGSLLPKPLQSRLTGTVR